LTENTLQKSLKLLTLHITAIDAVLPHSLLTCEIIPCAYVLIRLIGSYINLRHAKKYQGKQESEDENMIQAAWQ
jgi:hypothetical protein